MHYFHICKNLISQNLTSLAIKVSQAFAWLAGLSVVVRMQSLSLCFEIARHFWKSARPKWSKMIQNGLILYEMFRNGNFFARQKAEVIKMTGMTGPS